jgi:hypothetical protein
MTRDIRKYARQTNIRLLVGFLLILFVAGDGLIYAFYGKESAILGLLCLLAGTTPLGLIALVLWGLDKLAKRWHEE